MPGITCNACNREFSDDAEKKLHYKSEWHRYNLKRKVAGVPGVTEALFLARQSALAQEKNKSNENPMLYCCGVCGKEYKSSKAYSQHLNSRSHISRASQGSNQDDEKAIIKPLPHRMVNKAPQQRHSYKELNEESEDEWEEVDPEEELVNGAANTLSALSVNDEDGCSGNTYDNVDESEELDPACCFMCDMEHGNIERCIVHMHKKHGFFIPDIEYLKDPKGFLTFLGLRVKRDFMCLYCNDRHHPFSSLEAVRKHMEAKGHCKVHYGDGGEEEEAELEEFYDYSSSYVDENGKQLVALGETGDNVDLGNGGSELIVTRRSNNGVASRTLGSREFLRYYRQKPRPSTNDSAITTALASRYKSMGLATMQSKERTVKMKILKEMSRSGVEAMRSKIGIKNNIIQDLPKNVPH